MNEKKTSYDLIVVGGGFAGVCGAIAASKQGLEVLLIEKYNALGGAAVHALVMPFMNYSTKVASGERKRLCGSLFTEVIDEMNRLSGHSDPCTFDEEILKLVLNRMVLKYGVNLLFDTTVTEVLTDGRKITGVRALGKSAPMHFYADYFLDATGDAEFSMLAGCRCAVGREADGLCQPMTLCFRMGGVDKKAYRDNRALINERYRALQQTGKIRNPREDVLIFDNYNDGVLHFNSTRIVRRDPTDPFDITAAEIEAREQVFELWQFMKENIPGFENARILSTALQIGIRESRRVLGEYTLTEADLKALARFDDAVAVANYDIDIHNPAGTGTSHYYFKEGEWYEIPYRCLIPKDADNLLVAGRCISSTHEAQASYRVMPFCAELGQAAGTAIALAKAEKCGVREIPVQKLQTILRHEGYLI